MEVICKHCSAKLNIPDEKLPHDQRVSVVCPKCKNKLILGVPEAVPTGLSPTVEDAVRLEKTPGEVESTQGEEEPLEEPWDDAAEEDIPLYSYEEGEKLALVMDSDAHRPEKIKEGIRELGYRYVPARDSRDASGKMRFHNFDLMILADHFDNSPLEQSPILRSLNHLSMSIRRRMFLVLIGEKFKTMDHMMAFAMSANLVINPRDLDRLTTILKRAVSDKEKLYKVFFDTLEDVGKA